jgi:chemotaxis protein methyltransferase CheR
MVLDPKDFRFLADTIKKYSGISLSDDKEYLLEGRLLPVAQKHGLKDLSQLVKYTKENTSEEFFIELIEAMTTNESYFFRDTKPFVILCKELIPRILKKHPNKKHIRIWSAACSTGQEPYSIAMSLKEDPALAGITFEMLATDLDFNVLQKAQGGLYSQFEVQRGMPITLLLKYFTQEDDKWRVKDNCKENIKFEKFNLLDNPAAFGKFDIVFCRNVLIYFEPETKLQVVQSIEKQMEDHAYLLLGAAEGLLGMDTKLSPLKNDDGSLVVGTFGFTS